MDDQLLGYLLNALTPAEAAAVEAHLATHPADRAKLDRLRTLLAPLAADRREPLPPPGLAVATLARVAEAIVAAGPPATRNDTPTPLVTRKGPARTAGLPVRRWVEVGVAFGIGVVAVGLVLGGVRNAQQTADRARCANNLRVLWTGLNGYADTHNDQFPMVGSDPVKMAGQFAVVLDEGCRPAGCPTATGYAYSLGHMDGATLIGPRRNTGRDDLTPLAADAPAAHAGGQWVLFAGGSARFVTVSTIAGDDFYRNDAGLVKAGLHPRDVALGMGADVP